MTASSTLQLRHLDRRGVQPFLAELDEWLLPGALYGAQQTWPQLYRSDGDGRFLGLFDGERMLSHCAYRLASMRTTRGALPIALLGSVATAPTARGQGLASQLLATAVADCKAAGAAAILLWAERHELYARVGFVPGAQEQCATLAICEHDGEGTAARLATVLDHARLCELHAEKPCGVERTPRAMSGLLTTPGLWTCVLERDGEIVAYACSGKGADLQGWWHEYGGSDADVAALLPAAMRLCEQPQSIALLPPYRQQLVSLLAPFVLETTTIAGPMVKKLTDAPLPSFWIDGLDSV